mgnify:CR=1 FL=1
MRPHTGLLAPHVGVKIVSVYAYAAPSSFNLHSASGISRRQAWGWSEAVWQFAWAVAWPVFIA